MNNRQLHEVVERLMRGDKEAFLELCQLKGKDILYFSYKILENMQDAEDITQEILLHVYDHIDELQYVGAFQVWLYQIARRKSLNMIRKREQVSKILEKSINSMGQSDDPELLTDEDRRSQIKKKALLEAVNTLSVNKRMALLMYYFEGMKYDDIAKAMKTSHKSVEGQLVDVRRTVQQYMDTLPNEDQTILHSSHAAVTAAAFAECMEWEAGQVISDGQMGDVIKGTLEQIEYFSSGSHAEPTRKVPKSYKALGITAGVVAAGGLTFGNYVFNQTFLQPYDQVVIKEEQQATVLPDRDEEQEIHTLEDMIGAADARLLRLLAEAEAADYDTVLGLIGRQGFEFGERVWDVEEETEYSMYVLTKKTKQLAVIIKSGAGSDKVGIAFQFMEAETELPVSFYIVVDYRDWKEAS